MGFRLVLAMAVVAIAALVCWPRCQKDLPLDAVDVTAAPAAPAYESRAIVTAPVQVLASDVHRVEVDPSATPWRCAGRCVDQASGAAIAGCVVTTGEATVATDPSGRFELEIASARAVIEIAGNNRVGVGRTVERRGAMLDVGDVPLRAAGRVAGMLADDRGRPCGNRVVVVEPLSFVARRDGWRESLQWHARTAADGSFALATPLPAGTILVSAPELPPLVGESSHALCAGGELFLRLHCRAWRAGQELSGMVVDEDGRPVAGATVQLCSEAAAEQAIKIVDCDAYGRFAVVCEEGKALPVWLRACSVDGSLQSAVSGPQLWGSHSLRLQLSQSEGVWLRVVDAVDQTPIESFSVRLVATSGVRSSRAGATRHAGHHEGGRCWLRLVNGRHEVMVFPEDRRWLPNLPQTFVVSATTRQVTVALRRAQDLPVRVLRDSGRSLAGVTVRLVQPADNTIVRDLSQLLLHGGSRACPNVVVATSRTDSQGNAVLRWTSDDRAMQVRLNGPGVAPQVETHVSFRAGALTIRVPDTGVLRARIPEAKGLRLELTQRGTALRLPTSWSAPLTLDAKGELEVDLPVGNWQIRLATPLPNGEWWSLPDVLANVDIAADRVSDWTASAAAQLAAGEVVGQAHVDGLPATQIVLLHGSVLKDGAVAPVAATVLPADARGAYLFAQLRAGYYALQARVMCSGQQVSIALVDWFRLQPGGRRDCGANVVATAPLTVLLRSSDGTAVSDGQLLLRGSNGALLVGALNEHGKVSFARVPATSYELQLRHQGRSRKLGRVRVAPGVGTSRTILVR